MSTPEIQDAGTLASVVRFGWPWHGLISSIGVIGSTGKTHAVPSVCESWLIDIGLPAPSLTPDQEAAEAAEGRTWTNWAMIPSGRVYNKPIGTDTFIHIDEAGVPWRVGIGFSNVTDAGFRTGYTITRFGKLVQDGTPAEVPLTGHIDVPVGQMGTLSGGVYLVPRPVTPMSSGSTTSLFDGRGVRLLDVFTNGHKFLAGVECSRTETVLGDSIEWSTLISVVEVEITGVGGPDGSGLVFTATEKHTVHDLWYDLPEEAPEDVMVTGWTIIPSGATGMNVSSTKIGDVVSYSATGEVGWIVHAFDYREFIGRIERAAPSAFYDAQGNIMRLMIEAVSRNTHSCTTANPITASGSADFSTCAVSGGDGSVGLVGEFHTSLRILLNGTEIDSIGLQWDNTGHQDMFVSIVPTSPPAAICTLYPHDSFSHPFGSYDVLLSVTPTGGGGNRAGQNGSGTPHFTGALISGYSPSLTNYQNSSINRPDVVGAGAHHALVRHFCRTSYRASKSVELYPGGPLIGVARSGHTGAIYRVDGGVRLNGQVATPAGPASSGLASDWYCAFNRKTGALAFSTGVCAWV